MSVLHFVRQYQKIQDKCLVAQDGQDFRTNDRKRRRWLRYPIERHANTVYTNNLFYRFSKEFEKTAEYDVKPEGQFQYYLLPNNIFVYGYGKRNYLVTALEDEENYYCECSKFDRDRMLCCHIMKVMIRLGVKAISQRYILKRCTQKAVPNNEGATTNAHVQADFIARGMPLNNKKTMWFTNLSNAFANLAVDCCASKEAYNFMDNHIRLTRLEVDEMKKKKKSSAQRGRRFPASFPDNGPNVPIPAAGDTCGLSEPLGLNDLHANPNVPKNAGVLAPIPTIPSGNNSGGPGGNLAELAGSGAMTQ
ncbi:hypothetical protein C2845_PM08G26960 [Panicum miliaceum]|uniref:Protein FAR1-RELATED SEQUENCE n=1 Tax=Panicum miliaceum TaxID=4540 RepID=A0A3L6R4T1_PANMI|nr:hypothetical protein C2845_PM08G26960 [Panicum miliaceum]